MVLTHESMETPDDYSSLSVSRQRTRLCRELKLTLSS